ncbi:fumarylacetoacetate hydrolase family protein [Kitasatospora kifunensis]|uniref:2-keto-4-pentenoate hydratase/2-oxohepta-3-ene-1,7-dioic acid hydratase in catechol pathway n=1 Tax=Kitasatospora kifunensis TaxID=58351 RepID=A0A7W7R9I6_KITKI|nr:fumarylacetoacetate hydrolase family protein [Kitasatospora kifunensis]MBB4927725.1 2-keto-4-pentenoate hydratase/2-oxohepta-3-ene-1,7-dioic acid hydratase in catechol pathway [Kitasatospora kifunensis]
MKLMRLGPVGAERPAVLTADGRGYDASSVTTEFDGHFLSTGGVDRLRSALAAGQLPQLALEGQRVGAPVPRPGKVVCIGLNYRDHARETGAAIPPRPVVFLKDPGTVVGPHDDVLIPRNSQKTDWEVELAVVIGARARYLDSPARSAEHIAGYTISNDVSEREFQFDLSGQWDLGKSCETFNPLGPYLVTPDELPDPQALELRLSVDGKERQRSSTQQMIFDVPYLVWYLSQYLVLEPGDVINTGTPAGVALGLPDQPYLRPGQRVELAIDGLGSQCQTLVQA